MLGTLGLTVRAVGSFCGCGSVYLNQREAVRAFRAGPEGNTLEAACMTD